jgi:putative ABC transport system substrate-binding protein
MFSSRRLLGQMRRRKFLGLLGAGLAGGPWRPIAATAMPKQPARKRKIGFLTLDNADTQFFLSGLVQGLRDLGYGDSELHLEVRSAENATELLALSAELMALQVEILFAFQTPAAVAAKQAVHSIPVVFLAADPLASGLVENLSRPGGNVTGVSAAVSELGAKNLELIHELLPNLKRVAVLGNQDDPFQPSFLEKLQSAAKPLGVEIGATMLHPAAEIEVEIENALRVSPAEAILVQSSIAKQAIADLAIKLRLPAVSPNPSFVNLGGLASYSADFGEVPRRCAAMIVAILKGNRPGDLPVELPTKFWLALNLKTAKQLGLDVAQNFLMRADQLIE